MTRVVITSAGAVSPLGTGVQENLRNLSSGYKGIASIKNFDTSHFPVSHGAEARAGDEVIRTDAAVDRKAMFIKSSVAEIIENSLFSEYDAHARALFLGAGIDYFNITGYLDHAGADWKDYCARSSVVVEEIAREWNILGGHWTNVSACVASTQAIGLGYRLIRESPSMAVIAGGFDSMLSPLHYLGFYKLGALSTWEGDPKESCRPFDKNRCGLVIGEGASAYLLENEQHADKGSILAEIAGYASSMDAYMVTDPHPDGEFLARAALSAIRQAGITPDDIDCVHSHETGTFRNALAETGAMKRVFGDRYADIPVFSLKGQVGHLIGACGALELLAVIDSIQHQRVLPTVNFYEKDPDVAVRVVVEKPLEMNIRYVLKLNAAFGGQNTALVFRKYE
ncbi:MAG: beta-ketoacyl-[acyl-carrier-protein] synthase family protein [Bacteroidota bacterium]